MSTPILTCVRALFACATLAAVSASAGDEVRASRGEIALATYPWAAVRHPYFRGTDELNIYPYPMLDFLSRDRTNATYRTVVLENEYLRITFLPDLGGRIHEVLDKATGQPVFYVNNVIKPALIGQCGAWISGGVEWNTGPQGHTVASMQPLDVVILPRAKDGSQSVAIGETERIYGTKWTVVVTLRPGRSLIEERIRIYNPTETVRPYYFWNCTAVPNTKGFRFIYPMTLGTDHNALEFFQWPIHEGKDLTRGTNYQDAASIFAWHCDQDFFGSYNDDLDRGVVSCANHHQLPGKKAWTWGWGSYGTMHQMDLTDDDGPYNEVQTGPLLTQGEVGRLDPCEAVEWQEWWYPVHGTGGFTFANTNLAVRAERKGAVLSLSVMGTAVWKNVALSLWLPGLHGLMETRCDVSPRAATVLDLGLPDELVREERFYIELRHGKVQLARFPLPLDLPKREPGKKLPAFESATGFAQAGWQDFLYARYFDAEKHFRKALDADPHSVSARVGLAYLRLDSDPEAAGREAETAVESAPDSGLARYVRAVAADRMKDRTTALDEAWKATLDPATAVPGRALLAKLAGPAEVVSALTAPGPWQSDPQCRNRLAFACLKLGDTSKAIALARLNLAVDPLDVIARSLLWLAGADADKPSLDELLEGNPHTLLDLIAAYADLIQDDWEPLHRILEHFWAKADAPSHPMAARWAQRISWRYPVSREFAAKITRTLEVPTAREVFPHRIQTVEILRDTLEHKPQDGETTLCLGHLLFHLGRHSEGREMWKKAVELGAEPAIAYRALGMAARTLDRDLPSARHWLEKAANADPGDAIVARDLANVLFALADKAGSEVDRQALTTQARDRLKAAFDQGKRPI